MIVKMLGLYEFQTPRYEDSLTPDFEPARIEWVKRRSSDERPSSMHAG